MRKMGLFIQLGIKMKSKKVNPELARAQGSKEGNRMKKFFVLIVLLVLFTVTSNAGIIDRQQTVIQNKLLYETGTDTPYTGLVVSKYNTGEPYTEKSYVNGVAHGSLKVWHKNGILKTQMEFKKGKRHGPFLSWHDNGKPAMKCHFNENKWQGTYNVWNKTGQLICETYYSNGTRHGSYKKWDGTGKLILDIYYENGKRVKKQKHE